MSQFPLHLVVFPPPVKVGIMRGLFWKYAPVCLVLALVSPILIFYFIEQRKKELASGNDGADEESLHGGGASGVIEANFSQTRKRKNEDDETSPSSRKECKCRFCNQIFDNSQALGGHMNRHRRERENEKYLKAEDILAKRRNFNRGYQYGGAPTYTHPCQQGSKAGSLYQASAQGRGQGMSNGSMMGPPSRPTFQSISNQAGAAQQLNPNIGNQQNGYQQGVSSYSNQSAKASQLSTNGLAQPSYRPCTNSGQCSTHERPPTLQPLSYINSQPFNPYNNNSSSQFMQPQSNNALPGFLSQVAGVTGVMGATVVTAIQDGGALGSHAQSKMHPSMQQSSCANQDGGLFADLFGSSTPQAPLNLPATTPFSTPLGLVAPEYDPAVTQDQYAARALFSTNVDGGGAPNEEFFPFADVASYQTLGENVEQRRSFQESLEAGKYGSGGLDPSTTAVQESLALGVGVGVQESSIVRVGVGVGTLTRTDARFER